MVRETIRKKRDAMTKEEVENKSAAIAKKLAATVDYREAKTVLFYAAKGNEVQTKKLISDALKSGKRVLLPITNTAAKELEVSEVRDYSNDLKPGAFGIMEPKHRSSVEEERIDVVIVPGVAFDKDGHRLGYGLGYYDKLLHRLKRKNNSVLSMALAYDFQVVSELPKDGHDKEVDVVVTENGIIRCKNV